MKHHPEQLEHSTITVDIAVMRIAYEGPYQEIDLQVAVIKRPKSPYKDFWVLPGGHLNAGESFGDAARREWGEETHAEPVDLEPIGVFGEPGRDERGRYISFLFFGIARPDTTELFVSESASEARWVSVFTTPSLGFDHDRMLQHSLNHLNRKLMTNAALKLLPGEVTLRDLHNLLEQLKKLLFVPPNAPVESVGGQQESRVPFLFD